MRYDDGIEEIVVPHEVKKRHHAFAFDPDRAKRVESHAARIRRGFWRDSTKVWSPDRPELGVLRLDEMAEALGERPSDVGRAAYIGHRCAGLRFARAGKAWKRPVAKHYQPVVCVETGRKFDTVRDAATWAGLKSRGAINDAVEHGTKAGGYHWGRPGEAPKRAARERKTCGVVCVETGRWFKGFTDAAKAVGAKSAAVIHNALASGGRGHGFHWKYAGQRHATEVAA